MKVQLNDLTKFDEYSEDNTEGGDTTSYKEWEWSVVNARKNLKRVPQQWINFMENGVTPHKGNDSLPRKILTKEKEGHSFSIPYGNHPLVKGHTNILNSADDFTEWLKQFCNNVDDGWYDDQILAHYKTTLQSVREA